MKRIIATVGPSLLHKVPITNVHNERNIYRINGAHGSIDEIEGYITAILDQVPEAEILMDLPGNKVRTANLAEPIRITKGEIFELGFEQTNYNQFYSHLNIGDIVWANDSIFEFSVHSIDAKRQAISFLSKSSGDLHNNKGMHVRGIHQDIPFLFNKDRALIQLANKHQLAFVGLSFVRHSSDIKEAKVLIDTGIEIISKVETKSAVDHLGEILQEVEFILIDRGDLSTEVGIEKIPAYQRFIVNKALYCNTKVFLATQFLKNMELNPIPTIPEVIDLYNTLSSGIYGVQMSEETAIGHYPQECLDTIVKIMGEIESHTV
jgi:pyruvate kinase